MLLLFYAFHVVVVVVVVVFVVVVVVVVVVVLYKFSVQLISTCRKVGLYFCNSVGHGKFRQSISCVCTPCPF